MTRSIFDPTGGQTEHSGSAFLGPDAAQISHVLPDLNDETSEPAESDVIDMLPIPVSDGSAPVAAADAEAPASDEAPEESPAESL